MLDVPAEDRDRFESWAALVLSTRPPEDDEPDDTSVAVAELWAYLTELLAARRRQPGDDLLTRLVEARDEGDALTEDEMVWLSFTMLAGGFETVSQQIAKSIVVLLEHPAQLAIVQASTRAVAVGRGRAAPLHRARSGDVVAARSARGRRAVGRPDRRRRLRADCACGRQLRRRRVRGSRTSRSHTARQRAPRPRARSPLLPRRQPGQDGDAGHPAPPLRAVPRSPPRRPAWRSCAWVPEHAVWGLARLPVALRPGA